MAGVDRRSPSHTSTTSPSRTTSPTTSTRTPDLLVHWFEAGRAAARKLLDEERRPPLPQSDETGFIAWVDTLIG
jgi:hypothetical protein